MIGDRERDTLNEIGAVWLGNGVELATRMTALADELDASGDVPGAGFHIREVLTCEYNPTTGRRSALPESLAP